jgi:hypothetical protein
MSNISDFPDLHHFVQIRQRLWCNREFGQAAVMVGSGFSRNAERITPETPDLPLWSTLAEQMYDELYPPIRVGDDSRHRSSAIANPSALADEYETTFGRAALDDFLIKTIPDNRYNPGELHKLLMSLPWSDIFTTNYDTLLERTRNFIHERKYDLIYTPSDIPGKMKPRIIKLHGSFPSHRPFIFTEEDYRTYPRKFAPFVNMVQQSIMENTFCLIGFSGEDPNFLNWIGWVRDNLGESTPQIYLCGVYDSLSNAKKQILKRKNIIVVDLSPVFPKQDYPDRNLRHAKAMEWFLCSLSEGKPSNALNWSTLETINFRINNNSLMKLREAWEKERLTYPGWIICPKHIRENLWDATQESIETIFEFIEDVPQGEKEYAEALYKSLLLLHELNWRLETMLVPLLPDWADSVAKTLSKCNPSPRTLNLPNAILNPRNHKLKDEEWFKKIDWNEFQKIWLELGFAVARSARENYDKIKFDEWMGHLEKILPQHSEWQLRWFHEKCLFHLFRLEYDRVQKSLDNWPLDMSSDFWKIKYAGILAELGNLREAERIAETSLFGIRSRLQPYSIDYSLLSQEGWAMYLLKVIKTAKLQSHERIFLEYHDRWDQLEAFRCSPREIESLKELLSGIPPTPKPTKEVTYDFFPGIVNTTYRDGDSGVKYSQFYGFNFLRLLEEVGSPIRCNVIDIGFQLDLGKWTRFLAPLWTLIILVRKHDLDKIKVNCDVVYLASLDQENINTLYEIITVFIDQVSYRTLVNRKLELELLVNVLQLAAYLCFRLKEEDLKNLLVNLKRLSQSQEIERKLREDNSFDEIFRGILYGISTKVAIKLLPDLLSFPIAHRGFPDPFNVLNLGQVSEIPNELIKPLLDSISELIDIVYRETSERRIRAIFRLFKLSNLGFLSQSQIDDFARALWSKLDDNSLPLYDVFRTNILEMPEPEMGFAKEQVKKYLLSMEPSSLIVNGYGNGRSFFDDFFGASRLLFQNENVTTQGKNLEDEQCQQREVLKNRGEKCPAF